MTERQMVSSAAIRLCRAGYQVATEVPLLGRCIDMVFSRHDHELTTVEFKLCDWRKAVTQAGDQHLVVDASYICLPAKRPSDKMLGTIAEARLGLFRYLPETDWPFEELVAALSSDFIWPTGRELLEQRTGRMQWQEAEVRNAENELRDARPHDP